VRQRLSLLRAANGLGTAAQLRGLPRGYYGMLLAHAGVAVFIAGVTLVKGYEVEKDVRMQTGDTVEVGGYTFRLDGFVQVPGPNYQATRGLVSVLKNGKSVRTMFPEKRFYHVQQMPMTEAAIDVGFTGDLYVSLGEPVGNDAWVVRIYHKPFVDWIWGGALLMALGGILAITDRRYRLVRKAESGVPAAARAVAA
jgi:cytochrome c-type biogenesis protein CcmF